VTERAVLRAELAGLCYEGRLSKRFYCERGNYGRYENDSDCQLDILQLCSPVGAKISAVEK
jgi:hypothetical protein